MLRIYCWRAAVAAIVAPVASPDTIASSCTSTKPHARLERIPHCSIVANTTVTEHSRAAQVTTRGRSTRSCQRSRFFAGGAYVYVPREGIADEACNLPTGACKMRCEMRGKIDPLFRQHRALGRRGATDTIMGLKQREPGSAADAGGSHEGTS